MKSETHKPSISDEELSKLSETVYGPAFFAKLACYGIQPSNEVDEDQLRKLAVELENLGASGSEVISGNANWHRALLDANDGRPRSNEP